SPAVPLRPVTRITLRITRLPTGLTTEPILLSHRHLLPNRDILPIRALSEPPVRLGICPPAPTGGGSQHRTCLAAGSAAVYTPVSAVDTGSRARPMTGRS